MLSFQQERPIHEHNLVLKETKSTRSNLQIALTLCNRIFLSTEVESRGSVEMNKY